MRLRPIVDAQSTESNPVLPKHVAVIMDGNGRWAKKRAMPRAAGHYAGVESVRTVIQQSYKMNIKVLTLFAFSSENWQRPKEEVQSLMELFLSSLEKEMPELHEKEVLFRVIGERKHLSPELLEKIQQAEKLTQHHSRMTLVIALDYGGRWDILNAAKQLAQDAQQFKFDPNNLMEEDFKRYMALSDFPEPDLFIRTSGERRLSNFLLWDLAYTELCFTDTLWPDFREKAFQEALHEFAKRKRRFGKVEVETI